MFIKFRKDNKEIAQELSGLISLVEFRKDQLESLKKDYQTLQQEYNKLEQLTFEKTLVIYAEVAAAIAGNDLESYRNKYRE